MKNASSPEVNIPFDPGVSSRTPYPWEEKGLEGNPLVKPKNAAQEWTREAYVPTEGHAWNPTTGWPRNAPCFCGSTKKFKKCCLGKVSRTCLEESRAALEKATKHAKELWSNQKSRLPVTK